MMSTPTNVSSELGVVRRYGVGQPAIRAIAQDPRHRLPFLVSEWRLVPFGARHAQPARLSDRLASAFDRFLQCRIEMERTSSHDLHATPASQPPTGAGGLRPLASSVWAWSGRWGGRVLPEVGSFSLVAMTFPGLDVDAAKLRDVCGRFGVSRLEVFGSVGRGEASPGSDIDVLYELAPGARLGWNIETLADELSGFWVGGST